MNSTPKSVMHNTIQTASRTSHSTSSLWAPLSEGGKSTVFFPRALSTLHPIHSTYTRILILYLLIFFPFSLHNVYSVSPINHIEQPSLCFI